MTSPLSRGRPTKIVCVGRNYLAHARELGNELPAEPLIFLKPPSALIAAGEPIELPSMSEQVEYEGEIGVVIGERTSGLRDEHEAWSRVAGVVACNDVTARDLQRRDDQWTRAKGFDTFCPMGEPVPAGELDPSGLEVLTRVNGAVRQHGYARDMAFPIPHLIAWISRIMTLEPGDLLLTGTPEGVGALADGDVVEVEIPGVGTVRNPVRRGSGNAGGAGP